MKVKVCGMTTIGQLAQLNELGVDYAGLIFYEKSARFVGDKLEQDKKEISNFRFKRVGVFVNEAIEEVKRKVNQYSLDFVQLHGDESAEVCKELQPFASVIKAIRIGDTTNLEEQLKKYEHVCDYFLFDTDSKAYGGTGKQFNWDLLQHTQINKPFFLSGGIGWEDVEKIRQFQHPTLFAVDVNSRFETEPGIKDIDKLKKFFQHIK